MKSKVLLQPGGAMAGNTDWERMESLSRDLDALFGTHRCSGMYVWVIPAAVENAPPVTVCFFGTPKIRLGVRIYRHMVMEVSLDDDDTFTVTMHDRVPRLPDDELIVNRRCLLEIIEQLVAKLQPRTSRIKSGVPLFGSGESTRAVA